MSWTEGAALPSETADGVAALTAAAVTAEPVALVGGLVRDLLLHRGTRDLDVVVVGSGVALAQRVGERLGARPRIHTAFDTAELRVGSLRIDVAGARREWYPAPAALPIVAPAGLEEDLARRDFSINAMALPLTAASLEEVVDPHRGRRALAERRLTVLHERSFRDDPSRILRGVELGVRLGLRFDGQTEALARDDAAFLEALSPSRLLDAWTRLFPDGQRLGEKLAVLEDLALLRRLAGGAQDPPAPAEVDKLAAALATLDTASVVAGRAVLAWLARRGGSSAECDLARRFGCPQLVGLGERLERAEDELGAPRPPHQLEAAAADLDGVELAVLVATAPAAAADRARRIATDWRALRLAIGGTDLLAAGWPPGPRIGAALRRTRAARLDGEITAGEELGFALAWLADKQGGG